MDEPATPRPRGGHVVLCGLNGGAASWCPPAGAIVAAGGELVVVVPRGRLGTVLAWTEAGVGADRDAMAP